MPIASQRFAEPLLGNGKIGEATSVSESVRAPSVTDLCRRRTARNLKAKCLDATAPHPDTAIVDDAITVAHANTLNICFWRHECFAPRIGVGFGQEFHR